MDTNNPPVQPNKNVSDQNKQSESAPSSNSFADIVTRLVLGRSSNKSSKSGNTTELERKNGLNFELPTVSPPSDHPQTEQAPLQHPSSQLFPKRACRAPISRKFAHPCTCGQSGNHHKFHSANTSANNSLPPAAYTSPLNLYDPITKRCLPTSRNRDMLLKDCHLNPTNKYNSIGYPIAPYQSGPCVYDDLVCDSRRFRCVCKPPLHLYYESNLTTFGCVPMGPSAGPDGRNCRPGHIYNVISKECQKIFDVNELPPSYTTGVSATQFSFVTIVLIWILLLILIVTAKLRKLRTSNLYRNSPSTERGSHHGTSYRHQSQTSSTWLHPFIAAVNGHHYLNQHRTTVDRHTQSMSVDDTGNYNDTDFFLTNGTRRNNEMLSDNNYAGSQQSLNNPPPKFEEIYPSCPEEELEIQPPSNEDLPSYDEAMRLGNTIPPDRKD